MKKLAALTIIEAIASTPFHSMFINGEIIAGSYCLVAISFMIHILFSSFNGHRYAN